MNKKLIVTVLAAGGLMLSASVVQAGAVATAYLEVFNMRMSDTEGNKLDFGGDVIFDGVVNNNGDTSATLNGTNDGDSGSSEASPAGLTTIAAGAVPGAIYVNKSFNFLTKPADAPSNYAVGDVELTGSIINFGGPTDDAVAKSLSEVAIADAGNSGTSAGNNLGVNGKFEFTAATGGTITLDFLADVYTRAGITADVTEDEINADARVNWSILVLRDSDNSTVSFAPGELNANSLRSSTNGGDDFEYSLDDEAFTWDFDVVAGEKYQITIGHGTNANAHILKNNVPEPLPLALMSISLLGLGWSKRRQK